jgi:hypothetical protein
VTGTDCVRCERDLDHCHGALVVHLDGSVDCTEPDCWDADRARHTMVMDCDDSMFDGCGCLFAPAARVVLRAS